MGRSACARQAPATDGATVLRRSPVTRAAPPPGALWRALALRSPTGGRPLDPERRAYFEDKLGHDLGDVRLHTDAGAAESAGAVGARAYTVGSDVVFGAGQYDPHSSDGERLLAHELAHVAQQGPSPAAGGPVALGAVDDPLEHEADRAADRAVAGAPTEVGRSAPAATLRRAPAPSTDCTPGFWPPSTKTLWFPGVFEHMMIQRDYREKHNASAVFEYRIPEAGKKAGGTGKADIAVLTTVPKELYEIKPVNLAGDAATEAQQYVFYANKHCGGGFQEGLNYPADKAIITTPAGWQLRAGLATYGAIVYRWVKAKKSKVKVTAKAPALAPSPAPLPASSANPPGMDVKSKPPVTAGPPKSSSDPWAFAPPPTPATPVDLEFTVGCILALVALAIITEGAAIPILVEAGVAESEAPLLVKTATALP